MVKTVGAVLGGIFVGAVGMEIFRRACPGALDNAYARIRRTTSGAYEKASGAASSAKQAFWEGYEKATGPGAVAEPSV